MKRIMYWLFWTLSVGLLHLFGNNFGTFAILMASILLPPISLLLTVLFKFLSTHRISISLPAACEKGEPAIGTITIKSGRIPPIFTISSRLTCTNLFTGQTFSGKIFVISGGLREHPIPLLTAHSGKLIISLDKLTLTDPLGLFNISLPQIAAGAVTVMPSSFGMDTQLAENIDSLADNDEYSMTRPGPDPGEIYAIREYIPGDPIRSIHWKLTEKLDKIMVREFGLPVSRSTLILFDRSIPTNQMIPYTGWDIMADVLLSLSLSLLRSELPHTLGWQTGDGTLLRMDIRNGEDISAAIEELLAIPPTPPLSQNAPIASAFQAVHTLRTFDHVTVITASPELDTRPLLSVGRVTALLYGDNPGAMQDSGIHIRTFTETDTGQLHNLEL